MSKSESLKSFCLCLFMMFSRLTFTDFVFLINVHCWHYWSDSPKISRNTKYWIWILVKDCRLLQSLDSLFCGGYPPDWNVQSSSKSKPLSVILICQNYSCVHYRRKCRVLNISVGYYTLSWQTLIPSILQEMHLKNKQILCVSVLFCFSGSYLMAITYITLWYINICMCPSE
jgi:hypothetical protein